MLFIRPRWAEVSVMTNDAEPGAAGSVAVRSRARQPDRRSGIAVLLASLSQGLGDDDAAAVLRDQYEAALCRIVPVRSVRLHEVVPCAGGNPSRESPATERLCLEIPTGR